MTDRPKTCAERAREIIGHGAECALKRTQEYLRPPQSQRDSTYRGCTCPTPPRSQDDAGVIPSRGGRGEGGPGEDGGPRRAGVSAAVLAPRGIAEGEGAHALERGFATPLVVVASLRDAGNAARTRLLQRIAEVRTNLIEGGS